MVEPASIAVIGGLWAFSERKKYMMQQRLEEMERQEKEVEQLKKDEATKEAEIQKTVRRLLKPFGFEEGNELLRRICRTHGLSDLGIRRDLFDRVRFGLGLGMDDLKQSLEEEKKAFDVEEAVRQENEERERRMQQERLLEALGDKGKSLYSILGVDANCTAQQLRKGYQRKALRHHPDKNLNDREAATQRFQEIGLAYEVLSDPVSRAAYNLDPEGYMQRRRAGGADATADIDVRMAQQFMREVLMTQLAEVKKRNPLAGLMLGGMINIVGDEIDQTVEDSIRVWNTVPPQQRQTILTMAMQLAGAVGD